MYEKYAKLRDARGLTDYAVAKSCGIGRSTMFDWKSGRSTPKQDKLVRIAEFFDVPVSYFYDDETNMVTYAADSEFAELMQKLIERPELKSLLRASGKATKEDIEAIVRLLNR